MPAGFRDSSGVDFDDLFDLYVSGTKPANTGFRTSDAVDLKDRYAPVAAGLKGPDVGFRTSGGVDVSNLWARKGSASYINNVNTINTSATGLARTAAASVRAKTNGEIVFTANNGGTVRYHLPVGAGVGSAYQVRVFGTLYGVRNSGAGVATLTGKGGINISAALSPGANYNYDTGWQSTDDANDFVSAYCSTPSNGGASSFNGTMTVEVRRVSDSVIVRSVSVGFECTADSQS